MKIPFPELIIGSLMAVAMVATESDRGIAGMINLGANTGPRRVSARRRPTRTFA